jgi:hypothetical protein
MPLIYSFVAQGTAVLAEYTPYHGNFNTVALDCLQHAQSGERGCPTVPALSTAPSSSSLGLSSSLAAWWPTDFSNIRAFWLGAVPGQQPTARSVVPAAAATVHACAGADRMTITCDKHTFNFLRKEGFTFLVVADEAYGRQIPFAFLERVSEDFLASHATRAKAAASHSLTRTFGPRLKQHMVRAGSQQRRVPSSTGASAGVSTTMPAQSHRYCSWLSPDLCCSVRVCLQDYCTNNPDEISRIAACQKKIGDVKNVMVENIEKVGGVQPASNCGDTHTAERATERGARCQQAADQGHGHQPGHSQRGTGRARIPSTHTSTC